MQIENDTFKKEQKAAKTLVKKYPLLKDMWEEREKLFDQTHRKEARIEAKYRKMARKAGLKNVRFAYAESCFGIDVNNVHLNQINVRENRLLISDFTLNNIQV